MSALVNLSYFAAAVLFILGLKQMSSPMTARRGILWAGAGMVVATVATLFSPKLHGFINYFLILLAITIGGYFAWDSGKKVAMTDMPQMIALYNGMGGGAAAAIAAVELFKASRLIGEAGTSSTIASQLGGDVTTLALLGAFIGCVAFTGSLVAWAKLDGRTKISSFVPNQHLVNIGVLAITVILGFVVYNTSGAFGIFLFFVAALVLGAFVAVPVGGADMPVVISLFNAFTGLAVGFEGYVLDNAAMIIAGTVVGSAGALLTHLMAKAMNRSVSNVFLAGMGGEPEAAGGDAAIEGSMKERTAYDAAATMAFASQVVIVPGYGMAVAQAQHKVWELVELLENRGVSVKFAIHPVAGRMPGHMNVLLAEAGVPYDKIFDMDEINSDFSNTSVALVIGANDVVNPVARNDKSSPLYGMPILNADHAENVFVVKRGKGTGFSGVENSLFYGDNSYMVYGDGQKVAAELIQAVKELA